MERSQRISKILDKINARWYRLFEWLACEDRGLDWDGVGDPYNSKDSKKLGRDANVRPPDRQGS